MDNKSSCMFSRTPIWSHGGNTLNILDVIPGLVYGVCLCIL